MVVEEIEVIEVTEDLHHLDQIENLEDLEEKEEILRKNKKAQDLFLELFTFILFRF